MGNALNRLYHRIPLPVHPHVHGERDLIDELTEEINGSSPRTWGTRIIIQISKFISRFIPTYMGNADTGKEERRGVAVHPHVHGERSTGKMKICFVTGSSPRTWGTRLVDESNFQSARFIPTYMGNARKC